MKKTLFYIALIIAALTFIYPFIWMVSASLRPEVELASLSPISKNFSFTNYLAVFEKIPIGRAFLNSVFVTFSITLSTLIFSSMVGYALSRLNFRGRGAIFTIILFTMMIPFQITLIPLYVLMVKFGWTDTYLALIIPGMISAFGILLFRQYFKSIPQAIIDAAKIDGCSDLSILFRIVWPNSIPALVTVAIITFMNTWNEVLWPLIVIRKQNLMTMPQMVTLFAVGGQAELMGIQLASATLLAAPVVIVYCIFQRHFIASMAHTGIKG